MPNTEALKGGTVRYHRAVWNDDGRRWEVRFTPTGGIFYFSPAEGEVMGLTPSEPAPLVTCNGHSIDFDALPIGTVLQRGDSIYIVQAGAQVALLHPQTGQWHAMPMATIAAIPTPMQVVYQPAPL